MSSKYERDLARFLRNKGFIVFRSAGSQAVDIFAIGPNHHVYLIEVKSFFGDVFRVTKTKDDKEQWKEMCRLEEKFVTGVPDNIETLGPPHLDLCPDPVPSFHVLYALRRKGGGEDWRILLPSDLKRPLHWENYTYDLGAWLG